MTKQEQIDHKLAQPLEVGNQVVVNITYDKTVVIGKGKNVSQTIVPTHFHDGGVITQIIEVPEHGTCYIIDTYSRSVPSEVQLRNVNAGINSYKLFKKEWVRHRIGDCGSNPFKPELRVRFINNPLESLLTRGCYGKRSDSFNNWDIKHFDNKEKDGALYGKTYGGINFNPYVYDENGKKCYYQRDLVWNLEQKQLLIESIYNRIEIGKFIFKYNSWDTLVQQVNEMGHGYDFECVDGKQRFNAILEFVRGNFADMAGNFWNDLSGDAQGSFLSYNNFAIGEMEETSTHDDILRTFLTLNFTGVPQSAEHIEYVQSIKLK